MRRPLLVVFDLDGTIAESKAPLEASMGNLLVALLARMPVGITSGGSYTQFQSQFLARLPKSANLKNLYLLPTGGSAFYTYEGTDWKNVYAKTLSEEEMHAAENAVENALAILTMELPPSHGPRIERRQNAEVVFSALGQHAPIALKKDWDPEQTKRKQLVAHIEASLPWAEVKIGGMTSIDILRKGIDKRYGVSELAERLHIDMRDIVYVGDALYPGGNDEVMIGSGATIQKVTGPEETAAYIRTLLSE